MQVKVLQHSAVLLTFIKLSHGFKTFVMSIFEWPLKTCFTILSIENCGEGVRGYRITVVLYVLWFCKLFSLKKKLIVFKIVIAFGARLGDGAAFPAMVCLFGYTSCDWSIVDP